MQSGEPLISSRLQIPALMALPNQGSLTIKQLAEGLQPFAQEGDVAIRLRALYAQWKLRFPHGRFPVLEADLDGNGQTEVITALNDASSADGSGTLFVIYNQDGTNLVDRAPLTVLGAGLHATGDLDGDGRPEIIWSSTSSGANTAYTTLYMATWAPGRLESHPTGITLAYPQVAIEGGALLVSGGLGGGYGAGTLQRIRTDRYTWQGAGLKLVDQRYAPSSYSYHLLQDGILAEQWQRTEEAAAAYRQAMEPDRAVAVMLDNVPPEWQERFVAAVRTFAKLRLTMLEAGADRERGCQAAITYAQANPDFLPALNIPRGWANPQWEAAELCGALPNLKGADQP